MKTLSEKKSQHRQAHRETRFPSVSNRCRNQLRKRKGNKRQLRQRRCRCPRSEEDTICYRKEGRCGQSRTSSSTKYNPCRFDEMPEMWRCNYTTSSTDRRLSHQFLRDRVERTNIQWSEWERSIVWNLK